MYGKPSAVAGCKPAQMRSKREACQTGYQAECELHQPANPLSRRAFVEAGIFFGRTDQHVTVVTRHRISRTIVDDLRISGDSVRATGARSGHASVSISGCHPSRAASALLHLPLVMYSVCRREACRSTVARPRSDEFHELKPPSFFPSRRDCYASRPASGQQRLEIHRGFRTWHSSLRWHMAAGARPVPAPVQVHLIAMGESTGGNGLSQRSPRGRRGTRRRASARVDQVEPPGAAKPLSMPLSSRSCSYQRACKRLAKAVNCTSAGVPGWFEAGEDAAPAATRSPPR